MIPTPYHPLHKMLYLTLQAYMPTQILHLHDGTENEEFHSMLGRTEMPIKSVQVQTNFILPDLFSEGAPLFSHIIITGDIQLSRAQQEVIARYIDGSDDPDASRSSNFEKETLVVGDKKGVFGKQFEPFPGANLLISSSSNFGFLLTKLGVKQGDIIDAEVQLIENSVSSSNFTFSGSFRPITANFKNPSQSLIKIAGYDELVAIGAFRGAQNNARVVYIGNNQFLHSNNIQMIYDIISYFSFQSNLVRALEWSHSSYKNTSSECIKRMKLSNEQNGKIREGNLVVLKLRIEELKQKQWKPIKLQTYDSFKQMTDIGFLSLKNSNFTHMMKQQKASFLKNYDQCLQEVLGEEFTYVKLQAQENFIQNQFSQNFAQVANGTLYALFVPDFSRSFSIGFDLNLEGYNRLNYVQRVHAGVDREETRKFDIYNSVWTVCLGMNLVLGIVGGIVMAGRRE